LSASANHKTQIEERRRERLRQKREWRITANTRLTDKSRTAPREGAPVVPAYRWPGHEFVPRYGIVDPACNLPTSGCPNEMRDVQ
jgi:hypothetical protein